MATLAAVDPGLRACGLAVLDVGLGKKPRLLAAWLAKNPEQKDDGPSAWASMGEAVGLEIAAFYARRPNVTLPDFLVIERQRIYPPRRGGPGRFGSSTRDPMAILGLSGVVGAVAAATRAKQKLGVFPNQWKGAQKKQENNEGVTLHLSAEEQRVAFGLFLKTTGHNVADAIGLGKWAGSRLHIFLGGQEQ